MKLAIAVFVCGTGCAVDEVGAPRSPITVERHAAADHCGGVEVVAVRDPSVAIAPEDESLVAFYALPQPTHLVFGMHAEGSGGSQFRAWLDEMTRLGSEASIQSPEHRVEVLRYFADALSTLEIPAEIRSGDLAADMTDAFCGVTGNAATSLREKADELELQLALAQDSRSR